MTFAYHAPSSVDEALELLGSLGGGTQILAGGTDVMVQYLRGQIAPDHVIFIGDLDDELRGVSADGAIRIGALTPHRDLATHPTLRREMPGLVDAAAQVGGWQTQNVGTIGGNICNASPAADLPPTLLVANATVTLRGPKGERTVPLADFFLGRRLTQRQPDELLTSVQFPRAADATGEVYLKVGRRRAMEIAIVGMAMRLTFDERLETVLDARIAICAAAPRPFRAAEAERRLVGTRLDTWTLAEAGRLAAAASSPIDDIRASASYRTQVIASLVARAAAACRRRVAGENKENAS